MGIIPCVRIATPKPSVNAGAASPPSMGTPRTVKVRRVELLNIHPMESGLRDVSVGCSKVVIIFSWYSLLDLHTQSHKSNRFIRFDSTA